MPESTQETKENNEEWKSLLLQRAKEIIADFKVADEEITVSVISSQLYEQSGLPRSRHNSDKILVLFEHPDESLGWTMSLTKQQVTTPDYLNGEGDGSFAKSIKNIYEEQKSKTSEKTEQERIVKNVTEKAYEYISSIDNEMTVHAVDATPYEFNGLQRNRHQDKFLLVFEHPKFPKLNWTLVMQHHVANLDGYVEGALKDLISDIYNHRKEDTL